MLMPGWRYGHEHASGSGADVGNIVRYARRDEQVGSGSGPDQLIEDPPLALTLEHVERLFLNAMNVDAGGKFRGNRPIEHAGVLRMLTGQEKYHRMAA